MAAAAFTEGAILSSFTASVAILSSRHASELSGGHYGAVFLPGIITAVTTALIAARFATRFLRGRALQLGLGLSIASLLPLIGALALGAAPTARLSLLLVTSGLAGGGFGFAYPALTAFALDRVPNHAERSVLIMNLMLAAGLAVSPGLAIAAAKAGALWVFAAALCVLGLLIITASGNSRLGPDASRGCNLNLPRRHRSAWHTVYPVLALLAGVCAMTLAVAAQTHRSGHPIPHPGFTILLLASFWAAALTAARVAFAAIERRQTWQRSCSLVPFLLPAAIAVAGLVIGQAALATVGLFLLAAVICAAFLPLPASPDNYEVMLLSLACTVGLIVLYPAGLGASGPVMGHLRGSGGSVMAIFAVTGVIGIAASLVAASMPLWRRAAPVRPGPGAQLADGAVPVGAQISSEAPELMPAGRTTRAVPRPRRDTSRFHSCSASAAAAPSGRSS